MPSILIPMSIRFLEYPNPDDFPKPIVAGVAYRRRCSWEVCRDTLEMIGNFGFNVLPAAVIYTSPMPKIEPGRWETCPIAQHTCSPDWMGYL